MQRSTPCVGRSACRIPLVSGLYNRHRFQEELARTVWNDTDHSWYKDAAGRITNNWSGSTLRYWWTTRHADLDAYHQVARRAAQAPARERTLARPGLPAESRLS